MKQLYFLILIPFLIISCKKDETKVAISPEPIAAEIILPQNDFSQIIYQDNLAEELIFSWSKADFGVNTQINYKLEVDSSGGDFTNAVSIGATSGDTLIVKLGDLNTTLLNKLKVSPNVASSLILRVTASINDKFETVSTIVNFSITTWKDITDTKPAELWLPGSYQDWKPALAPTIKAISLTEFEGYVYIPVGAGFKFTSSPDWDHINYGDSGTPGLLTTDGLANGLSLNVGGYYKFYVNTETLAYEIILVNSWGMVGTATPGGWDTDTNLNFDPATGLWSASIDLVAGALKFRANDGWDLNYGPANTTELVGTLIQTNDAINITEAGNYTVTMDLRKTEAPYKYQYSVVKN